jgi:tetratricopeptide (TPR) repeat protein
MTDTGKQLSSIKAKAVHLLILAALCAYASSLTKDYTLDDLAWINGNESIAEPADYMRLAIGRGRPIVALSIILNHELSGLNVVSFHALNIVVHVLAGLTLFGVVRRTLELPRWPAYWRERGPAIAFAVALLWMVHPLQTQSVTYIIQRCESMMGLFFLLAFYCAIRSWDSPRAVLWRLGSVLCGAAGACCKEVIVGLPLVVVLYDWIFVEGSPRRLWRQRWKLYLGLVATTWGTLFLLRKVSPGAGETAGFAFGGISPLSYFLTQPGVIIHYLRLSVLPLGQCLDYLGWPIATQPSDWLLPGLAVALLFAATLWAVWRRSWLGFVGAWFFIILGPTSSFMPIADVAFEHRMYLPLASVIVLAVVGADVALRKLGSVFGWSAGTVKAVSGSLLVIVAGALIALTIRRNEDYRTSATIYADGIKRYPLTYRNYHNLGVALGDTNRTQARAECETALRLKPDYFLSNIQLGRLELADGEYQRAAENLFRGIQVPLHRAVTFAMLGQCHYELGNTKKAVTSFRQAASEKPRYAQFHLTLALLLHDAGEEQEAIAERATAMALKPELPNDLNAQARLAALANPSDNLAPARLALFLARQAVFADPEKPEYLDTLAIAYAAVGKFTEAMAMAKEARTKTESRGDAALVGEIEQRIELFERGLPYRLENLRKLQNGALDAEIPKK